MLKTKNLDILKNVAFDNISFVNRIVYKCDMAKIEEIFAISTDYNSSEDSRVFYRSQLTEIWKEYEKQTTSSLKANVEEFAISKSSLQEAIRDTADAIDRRISIFNAVFLHESYLFFINQMYYDSKEEKWDLYFVKYTKRIKGKQRDIEAVFNFLDLFCSLKIGSVNLVYPNCNFSLRQIEDGEDKLAGFFAKKNVRSFLSLRSEEDFEWGLKNFVAKDKSKEVYPSESIENLRKKTHLKPIFKKNSIKTFEDLQKAPQEILQQLDKEQVIQLKCTVLKTFHFDREKISEFLSNLKWPLYFVDFECYYEVIPKYRGANSWEHLPFLYFAYKLEKPQFLEERLTFDYYFSPPNKLDFREDFISSLTSFLGDKGSVLVYNKAFEGKIIKKLSSDFSAHKTALKNIHSRLFDLQEPFQNFYYYNYKQNGSISLKSILPAISNVNYDEFFIKNGFAAAINYFFLKYPNYKSQNADLTRNEIIKYCSLDAKALFLILRSFFHLFESGACSIIT